MIALSGFLLSLPLQAVDRSAFSAVLYEVPAISFKYLACVSYRHVNLWYGINQIDNINGIWGLWLGLNDVAKAHRQRLA